MKKAPRTAAAPSQGWRRARESVRSSARRRRYSCRASARSSPAASWRWRSVGAAAGTAVGGIFGAIAGLGVSEEEARFYEKEFHSGKAIVAVKCGDRMDIATAILRRHGGYDFQSHLNTNTDTDVRTDGIFSKP